MRRRRWGKAELCSSRVRSFALSRLSGCSVCTGRVLRDGKKKAAIYIPGQSECAIVKLIALRVSPFFGFEVPEWARLLAGNSGKGTCGRARCMMYWWRGARCSEPWGRESTPRFQRRATGGAWGAYCRGKQRSSQQVMGYLGSCSAHQYPAYASTASLSTLPSFLFSLELNNEKPRCRSKIPSWVDFKDLDYERRGQRVKLEGTLPFRLPFGPV